MNDSLPTQGQEAAPVVVFEESFGYTAVRADRVATAEQARAVAERVTGAEDGCYCENGCEAKLVDLVPVGGDWWQPEQEALNDGKPIYGPPVHYWQVCDG